MVTGYRAVPVAPAHSHRHVPVLHAPWFAAPDESVSLHRYLDDQFVPRFMQDAQSDRLGRGADQDYRNDQFGSLNGAAVTDCPTLRLPMHRAFHLVATEVSCTYFPQMGPAFAPTRIRSAGFVIRRKAMDGTLERWLVQDGVALGWQGGTFTEQEPSQFRRLLNKGLVQDKGLDPAYSGEETYPLHPLLVQAADASGRRRSHTLIWGYLPLGGTYRSGADDTLTGSEAQAGLKQELSWPFGLYDSAVKGQVHDETLWAERDGLQTLDGKATPALKELLDVLLNRYRITEDNEAGKTDQSDNLELREILAGITILPPEIRIVPLAEDGAAPGGNPALPGFWHTHDRTLVQPADSLLDWLGQQAPEVRSWLARLKDGSHPSSDPAQPIDLPLPTYQTTDGADLPVAIVLSEAQATRLREALLTRACRAIRASANDMALPRFDQGIDDRYLVRAFVRWQDDCGCERITWGGESRLFRVVSPLDAEAQRPHAIVLPDLDTLKRGKAGGFTVMVPRKLADVILTIAPNIKMEGSGPGNRVGLCWSFGFSLPVITLCAMILLMIMISILDLFFRWLPWAILALPRLCIKCLKP